MRARWSEEQAWSWYNARPWVMGVNYVPAITLHCTELWQSDTYDEVMKSVAHEFALMEDLGINSVRMFLPFGFWWSEGERFPDRIDRFLSELDAHGISLMPVLFNDCVGFGRPEGIQPPEKTPRIVSHGWHRYDIGHHGGAKSNPFTGERVQRGWIHWDEPEWRPIMEEYLRAMLTRFKDDKRIYAWDLWNEPGNSNRYDMSIPYLRQVFEIAREVDPIQPLTAGVWRYPAAYGIDFLTDVEPILRVALDESDIITFHQYESIDHVERVIHGLEREHRPMLNTEWLNRVQDNFVVDNLPLYHDKKIGSYSWGLVAGKSQFFLPWDELWQHRELPLNRWQHDLFDVFHTPYDPEEIDLMRRLSPRKRP